MSKKSMSNVEKLRRLCNNLDEDMTAVLLEVIMDNKKKQVIEEHPHKIYETSGGRWRTQIDEKTAAGKRKVIEAVSREKLEQKLVDWYMEHEGSDYWIEKTTIDEKTKKTKEIRSTDFSILAFYRSFRRYHDVGLEKNSIRKWDNQYNRFFKDRAFMLRDIRMTDFDEVEKFVISTIKEKSLCSAAAKCLIRHIKNTFNHAYEKNVLIKNPVAGMSIKKYSHLLSDTEERRKVLTNEEWDAMKEQVRKDQERGYIGAFGVEFAMLTGCRVGEIAGLHWEDIDENYIHIRRAMVQDKTVPGCHYYIGDVKSKKSKRDLPVLEETKKLFARIRKATGNPITGPVFRVLNDKGEVIHIPNHRLSSFAKNKSTQLHFDQTFGIHAIRRTVNSRMEREKVPVSTRAALLGHDIAVNTQYYTHDMSTDAERLNALAAAVG